MSHGEYGIPEGLQFGFPVRVEGGHVSIVEGLALDSLQSEMLDRSAAELEAERDLALQLL